MILDARQAKLYSMAKALTAVGSKLYIKKKLLKGYNRLARRGNVFRDRAALLEEIDGLPDYIFKSMFRVDKSTFNGIKFYLKLLIECD